MPKNKRDLPKKQGNRGNLPLPTDVIEELRQWKLSYELAWSDPSPDGKQYSMTYEQLIRRLLEGVKRLDPEVWAAHEAARKTREEQKEMMADFRRNYWTELKSIKDKLDSFYDNMIQEIRPDSEPPVTLNESMKKTEQIDTPGATSTDPTEGAVWEMNYVFEKDGEELEAHVGDSAPFYAWVSENGKKFRKGFKSMIADGWTFINDAGIAVDDISVAWEI